MAARLQLDADRRATTLRRALADEFRRLREDAGISRAAIAAEAGLHPSAITKIEDGQMLPTVETYVRLAAALGADFAARPYPNTGPRLRGRQQVRMSEVVLASLHPRWDATPEVAVRRPARGWVDLALHDPAGATLVAAELESLLRRIEQLLRWSHEKADSLPSTKAWEGWARDEAPRDPPAARGPLDPCEPGGGDDRASPSRVPPGPTTRRAPPQGRQRTGRGSRA